MPFCLIFDKLCSRVTFSMICQIKLDVWLIRKKKVTLPRLRLLACQKSLFAYHWCRSAVIAKVTHSLVLLWKSIFQTEEIRRIFKPLKSKVITCLSVPGESILKCSPMKIWPVKPLHSEKSLNIPRSRSILHNLIYTGENVELMIFQGDFLHSPRWFIIVPGWYYSESPWCLLGSSLA